MNDCNHCGFYDWEMGGCTCPHSDRWYAGACATATEADFIDMMKKEPQVEGRTNEENGNM